MHVLINLMSGILLQCVPISNHHVVKLQISYNFIFKLYLHKAEEIK